MTTPYRSRAIFITIAIVFLLAIGGFIYFKNKNSAPPVPPIPVVTVSPPIVKEITEWDEYI
ncbi:MAG TPA: hypothetical protein PLD88_15450, partial [Candidatus Berkiella sp.]|nr:hypothetical protein [Candidatus Berkiella sp.]